MGSPHLGLATAAVPTLMASQSQVARPVDLLPHARHLIPNTTHHACPRACDGRTHLKRLYAVVFLLTQCFPGSIVDQCAAILEGGGGSGGGGGGSSQPAAKSKKRAAPKPASEPSSSAHSSDELSEESDRRECTSPSTPLFCNPIARAQRVGRGQVFMERYGDVSLETSA